MWSARKEPHRTLPPVGGNLEPSLKHEVADGMAQMLMGEGRRWAPICFSWCGHPQEFNSPTTDFTDYAKFLVLLQRSPFPNFSFLPIALPEANHRTWNLPTRWYSPRFSTFNSVYSLSNPGRIPPYFNILTSGYLSTIPGGKRYLGRIYTGRHSVPKKTYFGVETNSEVSRA